MRSRTQLPARHRRTQHPAVGNGYVCAHAHESRDRLSRARSSRPLRILLHDNCTSTTIRNRANADTPRTSRSFPVYHFGAVYSREGGSGATQSRSQDVWSGMQMHIVIFVWKRPTLLPSPDW